MGKAKEHKFDFTESDQGVEFLSYSEEIHSSEITLAVYFSVVISSYLHACVWRNEGKRKK